MDEKSTLNYIKIFILIVLFCAVASLIYKGIILVRDGSYKNDSFNLLLVDKNAYIIHVENGEKLSVNKIDNAGGKLKGRTRLAQSIILGIFVDGSIISTKADKFNGIEHNFMSFGKFMSLVSGIGQYRRDNINNYDIFRIYLDSKLIPGNNRTFKEIEKIGTQGHMLESVGQFEFSDPQIFNSKISVQVLNGTDVDGFATKVGRVLQSLGYNLVETNSTSSEKTVLTAPETDFTSERLSSFFETKINKGSGGIADIKLILGEDLVKKNKL